jgi:MFS family permease
MGVGSLTGTLVVAVLGDYPRKGMLIVGGACAFGAAIMVFALSKVLLLSLVLLVIVGVLRSLYMTSAQTLLQLRLEDRFRGRVTAVYGLQWSLQPLGGLWAGVVADVWGAPVAIAFGGLMVIVVTAFVGLRQPEFRTIAAPPEPALAP